MAYDEAMAKYTENPNKFVPGVGVATSPPEIPGPPADMDYLAGLRNMVDERGFAREASTNWRENMSFPLSEYIKDPNPTNVPNWLADMTARPGADIEGLIRGRLASRGTRESFGTGPIDRIYKTGVGGPDELAEGIGYERINIKPFQMPSSIRQNMSMIKRQEEQEAIERAMTSRGLREEDISIEPKKFLRLEGEELPEHDVAKSVRQSLSAENLWREAKGFDTRATTGKLWRDLWVSQPENIKDLYWSPKDYFIFSYRQYQRNPSKMKQSHPDEFRLIDKMLEAIGESK
jgi:hypothetical protein